MTAQRFSVAKFLSLVVFISSLGCGEQAFGGQPEKGVVYVVGGVGGFDFVGQSAEHAIPAAGVHHEVRDFVWTHRLGSVLKDLQDHRHLWKKAKHLADEIAEYGQAHPEAPIYLIGKSGGAALALAAAELLPPQTLTRILLLSAAVSPTYDLRPALRACQHEMVSFHSKHDRVLLGWGTTNFGTADRVYGPSAGLSGFSPPEDLDDDGRLLYERLVQIPWKPQMIKGGHLGNHLGTSMPGFLKREVAPWLK